MPIGTFACSYHKYSAMKNFFRMFLALLLALTVFTVIMLIVALITISSVTSSKDVLTGKNAVLVVDLAQHFSEVEQSDPVSAITGEKSSPPSLYNMVRLIRHAKNNSAVKGIFVKSGGNNNEFASSLEIRKA